MARITLTLYALDGSGPLPGQAPVMLSLKRINADSSVDVLAPVGIADIGSGDYQGLVSDALVTPSSVLRYVIDAGANATSRFYDGEINTSGPALPAQAVAVLPSAGAQVFMGKGDRFPSLLYQLVGQNGAAVDLTAGGPVVVFNLVGTRGGVVLTAVVCTIVDAANGKVLLAWPVGSTSTPGDFYGNFVLTQSGLQSSYPVANAVVVRISPALV